MACMTTSPSLSGNIFQPALRAMQFRQRFIVTCWSDGPKVRSGSNSEVSLPSSPLLHSGLGSAGYIVVSAGLTIIRETLSSCPAALGPVSVKEASMIGIRTAFAVALVVPFFGALLSAEAAKGDQRAARAECFRQAQAAVNAIGFSPTTADKNAVGMDAYRQCCFKAGIRP